MKRRIICISLLLCLCFSTLACQVKQKDMQDFFPKDSIENVKIYYQQLENKPSFVLEKQMQDFSLFVQEIYRAVPTEILISPYSPELEATHRIVLYAQSSSQTLYYDGKNDLLFLPVFELNNQNEEVKTYMIFSISIKEYLDSFETSVTYPFVPTIEPPLSIDALLRAEIIQEELDKLGEAIDYESFDYQNPQTTPLYGVLTYQDNIPNIDNGYLLVVASLGEKSTGGYEIDISSIEENESYYIVRIANETPVEGVDVADTSTNPTVAVKIDARLMKNDKIIVFLDGEGGILKLQKINRSYFTQLPNDMPPLQMSETLDDDIVE